MQTDSIHINTQGRMSITDALFDTTNLLNIGIGALSYLCKSAVLYFATKGNIDIANSIITLVSVTLLCLINLHKFYPIGKKWWAAAIKRFKK